MSFATIINDKSITVIAPSEDGHWVWHDTDENFEKVKSVLRNTAQPFSVKLAHLKSLATSAEDKVNRALQQAIARANNEQGFAKVALDGGRVVFDDRYILPDEGLRRILHLAEQGYDAAPVIMFYAKLMHTPSKTIHDRLWTFLSKHNMPLTADGNFLAYKIVRNDYKDIYTGTMDNSVGRELRVPRNAVDDDMSRTCSKGLHACSREYLPHYGDGSRDRVVIVEISPDDVVAIPDDYNDAKMRVCAYTVVGEISNREVADIFTAHAIADSDAISHAGVSWGKTYDASEAEMESDDWTYAYESHDEGNDAEEETSDDEYFAQPAKLYVQDSITGEFSEATMLNIYEARYTEDSPVYYQNDAGEYKVFKPA
jgi:hypothetical protein